MESAQASPWSPYFRLVQFLAHAATAIALLWAAFTTSCPVLQPEFQQVYGASSAPRSYLVSQPFRSICPTPRTNASAMGFPSADWSDAWCEAMQPPSTWDQQIDIRSFTLGSSWNVMVVLACVEWMSASYALTVVEEPRWLWALVPAPPGVLAQPMIASMWNITLLVMIWVLRARLAVPDNNLFLLSALLVKSVFAQNYIAGPPREKLMNKDKAYMDAPTQWKFDHFLRQRKRGAQSESAPSAPLHQANYQEAMDLDGDAVVLRLIDMSSTAPLLFIITLSPFDNLSLVWVYQVLFVAAAVSVMALVVVHHALTVLRFMDSSTYNIRVAASFALIASWLAFAAALVVYLWSAQSFLGQSASTTGVPPWAVGSVWTVALGYTIVQINFARLYGPFLGSQAQSFSHHRHPILEAGDWVVTWTDATTLVVKLIVAWLWFANNLTCSLPTC